MRTVKKNVQKKNAWQQFVTAVNQAEKNNESQDTKKAGKLGSQAVKERINAEDLKLQIVKEVTVEKISIEEVAERHNIPQIIIRKNIKHFIKSQKSLLGEPLKEQIIKEVAVDLMSHIDVSNRHNIPVSQIRKIILEAGVKLPKQPDKLCKVQPENVSKTPTPLTREQLNQQIIKEVTVDLMSPIEVSNQHKIPVPQIRTIIKAVGIKLLEKSDKPQEVVSKEQLDPLLLLRHYTMNDKTIKEDGNNVIFGKFSWPKSVKTNFRIVGWDKKEAEAWEYYTLESLLYFLKNQTLCHLKYSQDASNKNIYPVRRADRRAILDYLRGLKADSVSIQKSGIKLPDPYKVTAAMLWQTSQMLPTK